MTRPADLPTYDVRLARVGEEDAICRVCRAGFAASSRGLIPPAAVERQADAYYDPDRVRDEIVRAGETPRWQGYVVAVSATGEVLGAAGGGVAEGRGQVHVLYLDLSLRGRGIGSALLDFLTRQQTAEGATEQWVSVTEGNELGLPFYRARGFVVRGRVPFIEADGVVEAWSLRLSRAV